MKNTIADGYYLNQNQLNYCELDLIQEADPNDEKTIKNSEKLGYNSQVSDIFLSKLSRSGEKEGEDLASSKRIYPILQAYKQESMLKQVDSVIEINTEQKDQQITDELQNNTKYLFSNQNSKSIDQQELNIISSDQNISEQLNETNQQNEKQAVDNQKFSNSELQGNVHHCEEDILNQDQLSEKLSSLSQNTCQYIYEDENSSDSLIDEKVIEFRKTQANEEDYEEDCENQSKRISSGTVFIKGKSKELQSATIRKVEEEDIEDEEDEESEGGKKYYKKNNNYFRMSPEIIQIPANSFAKKYGQLDCQSDQIENTKESRIDSDSQVLTPQLNPQCQEESKVLEVVSLQDHQQGDMGICNIERQFSFKSSSQNGTVQNYENISKEKEGQQNTDDYTQINQKQSIDDSEKENLKFIIRKLNSKGDINQKMDLMSEGSMSLYEQINDRKPQAYKVGSMHLFSSSQGGVSAYNDDLNGNSDRSTLKRNTENVGNDFLQLNKQNQERVRSEEKANSPFASNEKNNSSLIASGFPFGKSGRGIFHSYRNPLDITEREQQILKSKKKQQKNNIFNIQNNKILSSELSQHSIEQGNKLNQCFSIHSVGDEIPNTISDTINNDLSSSSQIKKSTQNQNQINNPVSFKKRILTNQQHQSHHSPQPSSGSSAFNKEQINTKRDTIVNYYKSDQVIQNSDQFIENSIQNESNRFIIRQGSNQSIKSIRKTSINHTTGVNSAKKNTEENNSNISQNNNANLKQFQSVNHENCISGRSPINFSESPSIRSRMCQTQHIQENIKKIQGVKGNIFQSSIQSQQNYLCSEQNTQHIQNKSDIQSVQNSTQITTNVNTINNSHICNNSYNNGFNTYTNPSPILNPILHTYQNNSSAQSNQIQSSQNTVLSSYNKQQHQPNTKQLQINSNSIKLKQQQFTNIHNQQTNRSVQAAQQQVKVSSLNSSLIRKVNNKRRIASPNSNIFSKQNVNFTVSHNSSQQNPHTNYNQINNKGSNNISPNNQKQYNQQKLQGYNFTSQQATLTNPCQRPQNKLSIGSNICTSSSVSQHTSSNQNNTNNNSIFHNNQNLQIYNNSIINQPSILLMGASNTLTPSNNQNCNFPPQNFIGGKQTNENGIIIQNQQSSQNQYIKVSQNQTINHPSQVIFTGQQQSVLNTNQSISPKLHQRSNSRSKSQLYTQQVQECNSIENAVTIQPSTNQINNFNLIQANSNGQDQSALDIYGSFYYKTLNKSSLIYSPKRYSIDYPNAQSSTSSSSNTRQIVKDILKRQLNNNNQNNSKINEKLKKTTQIYLGNNTTSIYQALNNQNTANNLSFNQQKTQNSFNNYNQSNIQSSFNNNDSVIGIGYTNQINCYPQTYSHIPSASYQNQHYTANGLSNQITSSQQVGSAVQYYHQQNSLLNSKVSRNINNEETQYTLKTLPSAISLADCKQSQIQIQNPQYLPHQSHQFNQVNFNSYQNACNSTRPSRKSNYKKATSLNQKSKGPHFSRNSSLFENTNGSQNYISTLNVNNNYTIANNNSQQNSYVLKNNLNTLKLDNNSKSTLKKYIRASSELRKRPIRQVNVINKTNNSNNNSYIVNNQSNQIQNVWLSVNGTSASIQNQNIYQQDQQKSNIIGQLNQLNSHNSSQQNHLYSNSSSDILQNNQKQISKSIQESPQKKSVIKLLYERINSQSDEIAYDTFQQQQ
ncbi:hypothetical protein TTHERM_00418220 (macronuclear) [Tetrahymena thermophila SB210]|uniref:Uncharacterized protein n=1 Tax=Tetrahymena thermophila (strain SB210) TaxID=312017 RepID=Q22NX3_TETTS|nr:hypothetical protein TTHERM_00418220 [Tetrahymena thermophila SB210]EAR87038.1 hypothetical protein TTHERM_00418220 [Tetrahymena thermophila SB210]|eukprot:XP_001007283.1 hypothetical protein TTHERM_00418220 [Tetrahymena thermophila SB210]